MKKLIYFFLVPLCFNLSAQEPEKVAVQKTIETFFDGFHKQDSTIIKQAVSDAIIMQTIAKDGVGKPFVQTVGFGDFLERINNIPETTKFEEIIKDYYIQIDGPMANAWTSYEFRIDDAFHHCGVNSFQLFKDDEKGWQIIYIIDTRREESCD